MHTATYIGIILDERTWNSMQENGEEIKRSRKGEGGGIGNASEGTYICTQ